MTDHQFFGPGSDRLTSLVGRRRGPVLWSHIARAGVKRFLGCALRRPPPLPLLLVLMLLMSQGCREAAPLAQTHGLEVSPLLVTFNLADEGDVTALRALAFERPATFFVAGALAERHPALVR